MSIVKVSNLCKTYGKSDTLINALNGVNFTIEKGEFVAIVGSSGSGKSTLLNIVGGIDQPTSGEVIIDGHTISEMSNAELTVYRRDNIGFVFQHYNLVPILNAYENIVLPIELASRKVDEEYVTEVMQSLGIVDKKYKYPAHLSGGEQQRVAIARSLVTKPSIILADEPTGNLDSQNGHQVIDLLQKTIKTYNQTLIMITHNEAISQTADRAIRIEDGRIVH